MANHSSSKKSIRQIQKRSLVNKSRLSRIRTLIKKVEHALLAKKATDASVAFQALQPELDRGVSKGVFDKNAASRKKSRLIRAIKAIAGAN